MYSQGVHAGCDQELYGLGYCQRHYRLFKRNGTTEDIDRRRRCEPRPPCAYADCNRESRTKGYCQKHYLRTWRHGTTDTRERMHGVPAPDRFWTHVQRGGPDECWPYSPVSDQDGYGRFNASSDQAAVLAHRYSYELLVGPIPDGAPLDHQCHEPDSGCSGATCPHRACVNPAHLLPFTNRDNSLRGNAPSIVAARADLCMARPASILRGRLARDRRWSLVRGVCADLAAQSTSEIGG